jgi:hypothetical protein
VSPNFSILRVRHSRIGIMMDRWHTIAAIAFLLSVLANQSVAAQAAAPNSESAKRVAKKAPQNPKALPLPTQAPSTRERLAAQTKLEAKRHVAKPAIVAASPLAVLGPGAQQNAAIQLKPPIERTASLANRGAFAAASGSSASASASVMIAPTSIDANVLQNLREPFTPATVEVGDRPARGTSMCGGDGKVRRFGDLDSKALAQNLPDFNVVRPRSVCVRSKSLIADYAFR